jgi:PAS domain S-box-containing protein
MIGSGETPARDAVGKVVPFAPGSGPMGKRIQEFDWSTTPLGEIDRWPQSLRTVVNILLSSRYAMWMAWGPELTFLCNDAYRPTLGLKDPWALGARADLVWAEIWPDIGPRIESVLSTGAATYDEGLLLFLERSGFPEETYHTFSYSPLADDYGAINGMLCVVTEESDRVIGERRLETLRTVAAALAATNTEEEVFQALRHQLGRYTKDLPFTLTYLFDESGVARLACSSGIEPGHPLAAERIDPGAVLPWPAHTIALSPVPRVLEDLSEQRKLGELPRGFWNKAPEQVLLVPFKQQGQERPAGFLVSGANPYRRYDAAYSGFVDLLSGQIAAGLANARAYETERRRAEALAEIDRAKTTFFSNVSHELRTPLTLMLSPVEELLARDAKAGDRQLLELVHRNGLRLQRLVNALLDFSRIESGRVRAVYEPTRLAQFTAELAANFRSAMEKAGLEFRVECGQEPPASVYVDRDMWEKIVLNLLSNALKFTFEGSVTVRLSATDGFVELAVSDTGTGIPASELPHIFERFHRVQGARGRTIEGTGIGLALVQELVKLHSGSIDVESEVSQGSTFRVRIPLGAAHLPRERLQAAREVSSAAPGSEMFVREALRWFDDGIDLTAGQPAKAQPGHVATAPAECILLADDNPDMRQYMQRLLSERYRVQAVARGDEALRAALADPPDLILSDVMMPGLDGFDLLKQLRERPETKTIPVVLVSARAGEESRVEGLAVGADDYLIKPFTARELLARVGAHISMSRRRREAEVALQESQATLQSFYDSSPLLMGVIEIDGEDIVPVYCNRAAAVFFNIDAADFAAQSAQSLAIPRAIDDLWIAHFRQSRKEGKPVHFEYEHTRPARTYWLSASVTFLGTGPSGRPRFTFLAEDVTERKRQEELLRRSNDELSRANADLEQFAYSASHDLQEPLRQVAIYSQLLESRYAARLDGKALQYLNYSIEGAQRMAQLINDLLAYSQATKAGAAPLEVIDANDVLQAAKGNLSTTIGETGTIFDESPLPFIRAERGPLVHVFQNLISNALKYRSRETPRVRIWADDLGTAWRFAVQDNGIGIPESDLEHIFGIFKRLHDRKEYPGNGIGLAICQKIVERYGGRIWVESSMGRGSTFFFTLPQKKVDGN